MSTTYEDISVLPIVKEYRDYYVEQQSIQTEIKNFRKKYEKRQKQIKEKLVELESQILEYMKEHDHPGLRFQEVLLLLEDKTFVKNQKARKQEVQNILSRYSVDQTNPLYREILDSLQSSRVKEGTKRIRLKVYKK